MTCFKFIISVLLAIVFALAASEDDEEFKVPPLALDWEEITCELKTPTTTKTLLKNVAGRVEAGRLLAILGPSGSGKTTLLNVLAGQLPASSALELTGRVHVNGRLSHDGSSSSSSSSSSGHTQAYVRQQDLFYSQLSVRETLLMAARLRLPLSMTLKEKYDHVEELMKRMGLLKAADTIVGDEKVRGVSGGEKKRLSLACELIGSPSLIFADEPTSGLDAFQAETLLKGLKDLAHRAGHTVVISIHQPRSSIFSMFDDITLMSDGEVVYNGPASSMVDSFAQQGYPCPKNFNPAEFALDLVSVDYSSKESEEISKQRVQKLLETHRSKLPSLLSNIQKRREADLKVAQNDRVDISSKANRELIVPTRGRMKLTSGRLEQFKLLFKRSWRQITRSKGANIARAASNIFSAVVFGALFFRMRNGQSAIQDRMGLLQVAAINTAMSSLIKTITVFIKERLIVDRERAGGAAGKRGVKSQGTYGAGTYFLSKLAAELPVTAIFPVLFGSIMYPLTGLQASPVRFLKFLGVLIVESYAAAGFGMAIGSLVPSVDAGLAVAPAAFVLFIIMGGYYVNQKSVPAALRWIQEISIVRWAFEALCINEFKGLRFDRDGAPGAASITTGEQVLRRLNFHESSVQKAVMNQAAIAAVTYLITYAFLALKKPKFEMVVDPEVAKAAKLKEAEEGRKKQELLQQKEGQTDEEEEEEDEEEGVSPAASWSFGRNRCSTKRIKTVPIRSDPSSSTKLSLWGAPPPPLPSREADSLPVRSSSKKENKDLLSTSTTQLQPSSKSSNNVSLWGAPSSSSPLTRGGSPSTKEFL